MIARRPDPANLHRLELRLAPDARALSVVVGRVTPQVDQDITWMLGATEIRQFRALLAKIAGGALT